MTTSNTCSTTSGAVIVFCQPPPCRVASNRNQVRRSASSIQFSNRLAVATSPYSSQTPCVSHGGGDLSVVVSKFGEHVHRRNEISVVVQNALQAADMPDRTQCRASDLAHAFGNGVGRSEDLVTLLVEKKVIIAKVRTGHVPMKILGLQIQAKHIGKTMIARRAPVGNAGNGFQSMSSAKIVLKSA